MLCSAQSFAVSSGLLGPVLRLPLLREELGVAPVAPRRQGSTQQRAAAQAVPWSVWEVGLRRWTPAVMGLASPCRCLSTSPGSPTTRTLSPSAMPCRA